MTLNRTTGPASSRAPRAPARFIAGLALVTVMAACGSNGGGVSGAGSTPGPQPTSKVALRDRAEASSEATSLKTASPNRTKVSPERRGAQTTDGIDGPYTLRIPRIGVHAPVLPIQSNEERVLNPPEDPKVAGWWSDGAAPGESRGSAVIVGHTVRNKGGGIFDDMADLNRGDTIEVDGSDSALTYRVKSIDVLAKGDLARHAEEIFAQTGAARLVIITCDDWDGRVWRSNIVTIAAPV
jgi:LPXTG-site transpeptidase (sortase) family protein